MTLDDNLGFTKNPFSKKSSEQELDFLDDIFFEPNYYQTLKNDLSNGDTRFIIGQRGHGKSSIVNKLLEDLEKENIFTIKIDRFDSIPIQKNETAIIKLILKHVVTKLLYYIHANKKVLKRLNISEKEKLSVLLRLFYTTISKHEYASVYNNFQKVKAKNFLIRLFNKWGLIPVNTAASAISTFAATTISKSLGVDSSGAESTYKEYFGEIDEISLEKIDIDKEHNSKEALKQILDDVLLIIKKTGFNTTAILFDKIDEFQNLDQDVSQIANFTKEILSDTELLMNEKLAIGFSLWSELKAELAGSVRFDKFGTIDVRWLSKDLEPLIDKRINYFSINKNITLSKLILNEDDKKELINLANKSPRDLIIALSEIYQEQSNRNQNVNNFEVHCILQGLINFCIKYDYDSIKPSKAGKNKEILAMINRILAMRLIQFTTKHLTDTFKQSAAQSIGQIKLMIDYKLIREEEILGANNYEVMDPKIEFLIKRGILKIE